MGIRFRAETSTPEVVAAQEHFYGRSQDTEEAAPPDLLGPEEVTFIGRRDSFYLASITSNGWPYIQHRGGPAGFLKVMAPRTLGFADLRGNRQLVTTGNLARTDRVALFLMDYPGRRRLKILGHGRVIDVRDQPSLADDLCPTPALRGRIERAFLIDVVAHDWNCPAYITPRFTEAEMARRDL